MIMRRTIVSAFATLLATASLTLSAYAQSSTAFTYQGYLQDNNNPANGTYDLKFTLYDAATEGNAIGNPVFIEDLQIQNGLFTVEVDFGTAPFAQGQRRWIEIAVRPGDSTDDHTTLRPAHRTDPRALRALRPECRRRCRLRRPTRQRPQRAQQSQRRRAFHRERTPQKNQQCLLLRN
jgi:hypothetical protein